MSADIRSMNGFVKSCVGVGVGVAMFVPTASEALPTATPQPVSFTVSVKTPGGEKADITVYRLRKNNLVGKRVAMWKTSGTLRKTLPARTYFIVPEILKVGKHYYTALPQRIDLRGKQSGVRFVYEKQNKTPSDRP